MELLPILRSWSLRRKAAVLLAFAAGFPALIVSALLLQQERDLRRSMNEAVLRARVDQVGDTLQALARGYAGMASRYADDPEFVAFCESAGAEQEPLRALVEDHLRTILHRDPAILGTTVMAPSGTAIASTDPVVGQNFSYREYFRSALAGEPAPDVFVGVPAVGRPPLIAFPAPIRRGDTIIGVYVVFVRAEVFWDVMRGANDKAGPGSFYILFDRDGIRIGHSANSRLLFRPSVPLRPAQVQRMLAAHRFQERTTELLASVEPFPAEVLNAPEPKTFRRFSPTNGAWNMGVSRYFPTLRWTLVAMIPERELEVSALDVIPQALAPILVGLGLALFGGAILIRKIVNPIRSLARAAAALERGDSVGELPEIEGSGRGDEVGALSAAFRSMAASLTERDRQLWTGYRDLRQVLDSVGEGFLAADPSGAISGVHSTVTETWFGPVRVAERLWDYFGRSDPVFAGSLERCWGRLGEASRPAGLPSDLPVQVTKGDRAFEVAYREVLSQGRLDRIILVITDVTSLLAQQLAERQLEAELRQAQKLEAVGQIAAGVAHEINTPIQYIGDGTRFVKDAFASVLTVLRLSKEALGAASIAPDVRERLGAAEEAADLGYVLEEVPKALGQVLDGVQRVSVIVGAMKEFAHPDQKEMVPTDLNRAITATLEISRNEYKYVADVEADLGEIPQVCCHAGDLNQVFLNIIVNAAHAIGDVVKGTRGRGTIRVRTSVEGEQVVVAISDTGGGIPCEIQDKVFEPFFTTKPVGKGTGQGLAIARSVVKNHGGQLTFESEAGTGTTFFIRLPRERLAQSPTNQGDEACARRS